jgi:glycosyltransferase involved in cell wall biosynthesis
VISTRVGGVDEIITHGQNGLLVKFGDLRSLEKSLLELIKNEDMRRSLSENALKTLQEKFTEDMMIDRLEKYFLEQIRN